MRSTSEKSEWSILGLAHKFFLAWEKAGGTKAMVNTLAQNLQLMRDILDVLRGNAVIKPLEWPGFTEWTVTLGEVTTGPEYLRLLSGFTLENGGKLMLSFGAKDILRRGIECWQEPQEVELVSLDISELGFGEQGVDMVEVVERAKRFGLCPCPIEVAPVLRMHYTDQPEGEQLFISWVPRRGCQRKNRFFKVSHEKGRLVLAPVFNDRAFYWNSGDRWVFMRKTD